MATGLAELPDDALAGVFRGLSSRSLAVVRCVCKAWRDIVDSRALLLPHLLPHSVRGVFLNYIDHERPHHFARPCPPSTIPRVDGMLSFLPKDDDWWSVMDHCNGLLLCDIWWGSELCVCNPATSRWTLLPRPRDEADGGRFHHYAGAYIAFDPAESPHFEVVLIPAVPKAPSPEDRRKKEKERRAAQVREQEGDIDAPFCLDWFFEIPDGGAAIGDEEEETSHDEEFQQLPASSVDEDLERDVDPWRLMEWPPTPWTLHVFSSRAGHWEERAFVRQGMPAGTVEKMRLDPEKPGFNNAPRRRYAIFHHGSLYVHCRGSFVTRLSLSNSEYQIIEAPAKDKDAKPYLGKLQKDVCFGIVDDVDRQLKIWTLNESCGQMEWVLKYGVEIGYYAHYVASLPYHNGRQPDGSWTIEEDETSQWDSDNDDTDGSWTTEEDETSVQQTYDYEWESDNDDTFTVNHLEGQEYHYTGFDIIGFHPFKDVVFMASGFGVVAYHLNASKIQYLGNSRPKCYYHYHTNGIYESFLYTPCMIGDLLYGEEAGQSSSHEDY